MTTEHRLPTTPEILSVLGLFLALVFSFTSLFDLPVQLALFIGWFVVLGLGLRLKYHYHDLEKAASRGIFEGMPAILILFSVGTLTGTWVAGGIVPGIIYYGLGLIGPSVFLPATVAICALAALVTGTSWGAAGTAGIAMMGIGESMNIPAPITCGAILSGVYFGDKLSPLSDSVVLASSMSRVPISHHIKGMLPVSMTAIVITLVLFSFIGLQYAADMDMQQVTAVQQALMNSYNINLHVIIPPALVMALLAMGKPGFPTISFGALMGVIWAVLFQGQTMSAGIMSAWTLPQADTGLELVNRLLERGGMEGMLSALALIVFGLGFGSLLVKVGVIVPISKLINRHTSNEGQLTFYTILTGFLCNLLGSAMYVSLILTPKLLIPSYNRMKADRRLLSRNTEFGGTLTCGMVPWSDNGIFMSGILGVSTLAYLPYMWLSWSCIATALIFSFMSAWRKNRTPNREQAILDQTVINQATKSPSAAIPTGSSE